jgi:hypothetical protein
MRLTERVGDGVGAQRHKCKSTGTCRGVQDRVRRLARTNKAPNAGTGKRQEASTCAPVSPSFADPHTRTRRCVNNAIRACFRLTHSRNEERETRERHPLHVYMGTAKLTQAHAQEPCAGTTRCLPAWGRVSAYGWAHLHAELAARRRESRLKVPFAAMFRSHREPRLRLAETAVHLIWALWQWQTDPGITTGTAGPTWSPSRITTVCRQRCVAWCMHAPASDMRRSRM